MVDYTRVSASFRDLVRRYDGSKLLLDSSVVNLPPRGEASIMGDLKRGSITDETRQRLTDSLVWLDTLIEISDLDHVFVPGDTANLLGILSERARNGSRFIEEETVNKYLEKLAILVRRLNSKPLGERRSPLRTSVREAISSQTGIEYLRHLNREAIAVATDIIYENYFCGGRRLITFSNNNQVYEAIEMAIYCLAKAAPEEWTPKNRIIIHSQSPHTLTWLDQPTLDEERDISAILRSKKIRESRGVQAIIKRLRTFEGFGISAERAASAQA
ncbi:MAG: hypothetical protein HYS32_04475 [Candidatus Woesearchaeota archaeon]|nr:MAG: hypothetical protein HYS32_04475 [Candidatus Woesearchaeota archaeon]